MSHTICLAKENFKFSCSHFTVLSPTNAERLHGHNYYVEIEIEVSGIQPALGMAFDFNRVKPLVRELADAWDEYVLLPAKSPYLKVQTIGTQVRAQIAQKTYEFPLEDVRILPLVNITAEELSRVFAEALVARLRQLPDIAAHARALSLTIQETRGQSVRYTTMINSVRSVDDGVDA